MKFTDVLKKSVVEGFSYTDISAAKVMITLGITFAICLYIFFVYRFITKSAFYSKSFNVSMAIISVVTAGIILAMQSSIVISLGMVGALSIVRFRTAIKDPMDLLFLFWSIGTGIICGAGLYQIAIIVSIAVTIGILILDLLPVRKSPFLLIINSENKKIEEKMKNTLTKYCKNYKVKSRNITGQGIDMIIELRTNNESELIEQISAMEDIISVSLLAHDGEVRV